MDGRKKKLLKTKMFTEARKKKRKLVIVITGVKENTKKNI